MALGLDEHHVVLKALFAPAPLARALVALGLLGCRLGVKLVLDGEAITRVLGVLLVAQLPSRAFLSPNLF
jgi:hypothetical protein